MSQDTAKVPVPISETPLGVALLAHFKVHKDTFKSEKKDAA